MSVLFARGGLDAVPGREGLDRNGLSPDALWRHQLARASQLFAGRCLDVDPAYVLRAVRLLARDMPRATTPAQHDLLRKEGVECASRAVLRVHAEYHRAIDSAQCAGAPMHTVSLLLEGTGTPRLALRRWARAFLADFSRTHPWPAAVHAAAILRRQRRRWIRIQRLCVELGVSRTALTRRFRQLYGMSLADYHRRAKMAWAIREFAASDACVESVALRAGYSSPGAFYDTLSCLTRLRPAQVRRLSRDELRDVLDGPLSLRMVTPRAPSALKRPF